MKLWKSGEVFFLKALQCEWHYLNWTIYLFLTHLHMRTHIIICTGKQTHIMTCQNKHWWIRSFLLLRLLVILIFIVRLFIWFFMYSNPVRSIICRSTRKGNYIDLLLLLLQLRVSCYHCSLVINNICSLFLWHDVSMHVKKINFLEVLLHHRYSYHAYHSESNVPCNLF